MDPIQIIALSMGAAWASGINLYATVAMLGIMGATGNMELPPELEILQDPMVIGAAGIMYIIEFVADKVPGVDTAWDTVHTFIRIPAGAILAAGAIGDVGAGAEFAAMLAGGGLAATTHATKAGTRLMINTSPEPVTNIGASLMEDVAAIGMLWAAMNYPWVAVGLLALFVLMAIWLLPKLWRLIKALGRRIAAFFGGKKEDPAPAASRDAGYEDADVPDSLTIAKPSSTD